MQTETIVRMFGALAQETRLGIYQTLLKAGEGGLPAGDLSLALGTPQNTLSFHLRELQNAGLIDSRRAGRFIIYRTVPEAMKELLRYMLENCVEPAGAPALRPGAQRAGRS
jgi:DNA-binding transcriptional ArsR family regulator